MFIFLNIKYMFIEGPGPKIVKDKKTEVPETELPSVIVDPKYLEEIKPDNIEQSVLDYIEQGGQASEAKEEDEWEVSSHLDLSRIKQPKTDAEKAKELLTMDLPGRESGKATAEIFNSENKKLHDELPPKGKKMTERIYDFIYKIPGINRVVGKLEIAYNQSKADKNLKVNAGLKAQMEKMSQEIAVLDGTKKELSNLTSQFEKQGSGLESVVLSLSVKVNDLDTKRNNLLEKKEKIQDEFEERENKIKLHTAEINRVADTLIERYNKSIEPLKKELDSLQLAEDKIGLDESVFNALHEEQKTKLDIISNKGLELIAVLKKTGMSDKEIQNFGAIKSLEKLATEGIAKIDKEKAEIAAKRSELVAKIEKTKTKAGIYEGKVKEFESLKYDTPILLDKPIHRVKDEGIITEKSAEPAYRESAHEAYNRLDVGSYINRWNTFLTEKYGSQDDNDFVKMNDFMRDTGLSRSAKLDSKNFKNILSKYYKYARIPTSSFNQKADEFFTIYINL